MQEGSDELMTTQNLPIPEGVKFLYRHLLENQQIVDIPDFDMNILHTHILILRFPQNKARFLNRSWNTYWARGEK